MITHIIYYIPGRKVGCTKNLKRRMKIYKQVDGVAPLNIEILEELHDKTDQEAGDIEWLWADRFGYRRGKHYAESMKAVSSPGSLANIPFEERSARGRDRLKNISPERRSEISRIGGLIGGRRTAQLRTPEERRAIGARAGKAGGPRGGRSRAESRQTDFHIYGKCPKCGIECNIANLKRYHFDKCKMKPRYLGIEIICEWCSRSFKNKDKYVIRRFCGTSCSAKWRMSR